MTSPVSNILGNRSYDDLEKTHSTEFVLGSSSAEQLQKNNLVDHSILSVSQKKFKHIIQRIRLKDDSIRQIPAEILQSQQTLAVYLFNEILENLGQDSLENLNLETLLQLQDEDGMDIVLTAIKKGKKNFLIHILSKKEYVNYFISLKDFQNRGMLHIAAMYGQEEILRTLFKDHSGLISLQDKDIDGLTPFHWAIHEGHEKVLQIFLERDILGQTWKCGKNSISTLALAVASGNPHTVSVILKNNYFKDIHLMKEVKPFGSILHLAILSNQSQMVEYLLHHEHHKVRDLLEIPDSIGRTPLQLAAFLGDLFTIKELYKKNVLIHQGERRHLGTSLHWAVRGGKPEAIVLLLSLGADPARSDEAGKTPLAYLNEKNIKTPLDKRCQNILDNFIKLNRLGKVKEIDFYERPPFNVIFEGNCTILDGFIGMIRAMESKKIIEDIRRYSGKGLGSVIAALVAIGYTSLHLENLFFQKLEDLFKKNKNLTDLSLQEIEDIYLKPLPSQSLAHHLPVLCDLTELRNDLEELISSKMGIKYLTFGQLKDQVEAFPNVYKHLHIPIYSQLKKKNIFFNTENDEYHDFVISDVLAASVSFLGLLMPAALRRKYSDNQLYEDIVYGKVLSVAFDTILVDQFDDLSYQEDPYLKGLMTNYRTCSLQLDQAFTPGNLTLFPTLVSKLMTIHFNRKESLDTSEKFSIGRVKKIFLSEQELKGNVEEHSKGKVEMFFTACNLDMMVQTNPQSLITLEDKKLSWKFDIFRKNQNQQEQQVHETILKQICTLPPFNIFFTGREKELKEIEEGFKTTKKIAIYGLGGIGKSTLSLKYANTLQGYEFIHFIKATALGSIKTGILELTGLLSIKKDKIEETLAELRVYLQQKELKGLLIIDGLDEESCFQELNNFIPPDIQCHILISTRIGKQAEIKGFKTIPLASFTQQEAVYYLTKGLNISLQENIAAEILAKEIGCLPLALSHIVRYIDQEKISLHQYNNDFQKKNPKLPGKDAVNLPDDEISVFITWQVSLEAIKQKEMGHLAISLMHFISTLGEEDIPFSLFVAWSKNLNLQYEEPDIRLALKLLKDYDFLKEKKYEEYSNTYYNVHSLVQKIIIYQLKQAEKDKEVRRESIKVLNQEMHEFRRPYREFISEEKGQLKKFYEINLTNILLFKHIDQDTDLEEYIKVLSCLAWILSKDYHNCATTGEYINQGVKYINNLEESKKKLMMAEFDMISIKLPFSNFRENIQVIEKVLELRSEIGQNDSDYIIKCHNKLGNIYQKKRMWIKSLCAYEKVLMWQKRKLNNTNACITKSYKRVIRALMGCGRVEDALKLAEEMLKTRKEVFGEGNWQTLESYKEMIAVLKLYKKEDALKVAEEMLKTRRNALGEGDQQTLESYIVIIDVLNNLRRYEEALEVAKEMLKTRKEALGEGAYWTQQSYNQVIDMLEELGRYEDQVEVAKEMLKARKKSLGEHDYHTSVSYNRVIFILSQLGRYQDVLEVAHERLKARKEDLGEGDQQTSESYQQVIKALKKLGKYEDALEIARNRLKARKETLGEGHWMTLESYQQAIKALKKLEKKEEALALAKEMFKIKKAALGEESGQTLECYKEMIDVLEWLGKKKDALELAKEMFKNSQKKIHESDENILDSHRKGRVLVKELGRHENAIEVAKEMFKKRKQILEENSFEVIDDYKKIFNLLKNLKRYEDALEWAQERLQARREVLGEDNIETANSYQDVINILKELRRYEDALEWAQEMFKTRKQFLKENTWQVIDSYREVLSLLKNLGRYEDALEWAKERLQARREVLGEDNIETANSYQDVINILKELRRYEDALEWAQEMFKTRKQFLEENTWQVINSYREVLSLLKNLGRYEDALEWAKERLQARREALGDKSIFNSNSYQDVINILKGLRRYEDALEVAKEMFKTGLQILEEDDRCILQAYKEVIGILKELGMYEDILQVSKEILKASKNFLGKDDPWMLQAYKEAIGILKELGMYEDILQVSKEMLKASKNSLGEANKWASSNYQDIIDALIKLGRYEDAVEVAKERLRLRVQALGEADSWTSESYEQLITILKKFERHEDVLEVAKEMLKVRIDNLGTRYYLTKKSYQDVIEAFKVLTRYEEALEIAKEMFNAEKFCRDIGVTLEREGHKQVINILKTLGRKEEIVEVIREILEIQKKILGERSKENSDSYKEIIEMFKEIGVYKEALKIIMEIF